MKTIPPLLPRVLVMISMAWGAVPIVAQTAAPASGAGSGPLCVSLAERLNLNARFTPVTASARGDADNATSSGAGAVLSAELLKELRARATSRRADRGDSREPVAGRIDFRVGPGAGADAGEPALPSPLFRSAPNGSVDSLLVVEQTLWATPAASSKPARAWYSYVKLAWAGGALEAMDNAALGGGPRRGFGIHDDEIASLNRRGREAAGTSAASAAVIDAPALDGGYRLSLNEKMSLRPDVERLPFPAANLRSSAWMGSVRLSIVY